MFGLRIQPEMQAECTRFESLTQHMALVLLSHWSGQCIRCGYMLGVRVSHASHAIAVTTGGVGYAVAVVVGYAVAVGYAPDSGTMLTSLACTTPTPGSQLPSSDFRIWQRRRR